MSAGASLTENITLDDSCSSVGSAIVSDIIDTGLKTVLSEAGISSGPINTIIVPGIHGNVNEVFGDRPELLRGSQEPVDEIISFEGYRRRLIRARQTAKRLKSKLIAKDARHQCMIELHAQDIARTNQDHERKLEEKLQDAQERFHTELGAMRDRLHDSQDVTSKLSLEIRSAKLVIDAISSENSDLREHNRHLQSQLSHTEEVTEALRRRLREFRILLPEESTQNLLLSANRPLV